jgi:hypothetical protein
MSLVLITALFLPLLVTSFVTVGFWYSMQPISLVLKPFWNIQALLLNILIIIDILLYLD